MANIALHLGSASLTIVLFVGAILLATADHVAWGKFFVIGVYLGTWNTDWSYPSSVDSWCFDLLNARSIPPLKGYWGIVADGRMTTVGATRPGPGPRPAGDSPPVRGLAQHRAQVCPCPDPAYQPPAKPRLQTLFPTHHQTLGLTLLLPICTDKIPGQQHYKWLIF